MKNRKKKVKIDVKKYSSEQLCQARQNIGYIKLYMRILQS